MSSSPTKVDELKEYYKRMGDSAYATISKLRDDDPEILELEDSLGLSWPDNKADVLADGGFFSKMSVDQANAIDEFFESRSI